MPPRSHVRTRTRLAAVVLVLLASIMAVAIAMSFASAHRVLTPGEVRARTADGAPVELSGTVVRGSLRAGAFTVGGGGSELRVRYSGVAPDGLQPGRSVRVTGRFRDGEVIAVADGVRASCDGDARDQHC